jgi:hypothetical protein
MSYIEAWIRANFLLSSLLYWVPLTFCVVGYTWRTWTNFRKDRKARENDKNYYPTDTVGSLVGRALVSVLPLANMWAALFDLSPEVFGRLFTWIGKVFDQPLVPVRKPKP